MPITDRVETNFSEADLGKDTFVINDIYLTIPPQNISVNKEDLVYQWRTLRSNVTTKNVSGHGQVSIGVFITFTAKQFLEMHRLIVELRNNPFCYIENRFLRETIVPDWLATQNMAFTMTGIQVNPLDGSSDSWTMQLELLWFNYRPYMHNYLYKKEWQTNLLFTNRERESTFAISKTIGWSIDPVSYARIPMSRILAQVSAEELLAGRTTEIVSEQLYASQASGLNLGQDTWDVLRGRNRDKGRMTIYDMELAHPGITSDMMPLPDNMAPSSYVAEPILSNIYVRYINLLQRDALLVNFGIDLLSSAGVSADTKEKLENALFGVDKDTGRVIPLPLLFAGSEGYAARQKAIAFNQYVSLKYHVYRHLPLPEAAWKKLDESRLDQIKKLKESEPAIPEKKLEGAPLSPQQANSPFKIPKTPGVLQAGNYQEIYRVELSNWEKKSPPVGETFNEALSIASRSQIVNMRSEEFFKKVGQRGRSPSPALGTGIDGKKRWRHPMAHYGVDFNRFSVSKSTDVPVKAFANGKVKVALDEEGGGGISWWFYDMNTGKEFIIDNSDSMEIYKQDIIDSFDERVAHSRYQGQDPMIPYDGEILKSLAMDNVYYVGQYKTGGRYIIMEHDEVVNGQEYKSYSMYMHLDHVFAKPGEQWNAGEIIGTVGSSSQISKDYIAKRVARNEFLFRADTNPYDPDSEVKYDSFVEKKFSSHFVDNPYAFGKHLHFEYWEDRSYSEASDFIPSNTEGGMASVVCVDIVMAMSAMPEHLRPLSNTGMAIRLAPQASSRTFFEVREPASYSPIKCQGMSPYASAEADSIIPAWTNESLPEDQSLENTCDQELTEEQEDERLYRELVNTLVEDGWTRYDKDPHVLNMWEKVVGMTISHSGMGFTKDTDFTEYKGVVMKSVSGGFNHLVASLPILSEEFPTQQHLGSIEPEYNFEFFVVDDKPNLEGLNQGGIFLEAMRETLHKNARSHREILDGWTLSVDTFITRLFGSYRDRDILSYTLEDKELYLISKRMLISRGSNQTAYGNPGLSILNMGMSETNTFDQERLVDYSSGYDDTENKRKAILKALCEYTAAQNDEPEKAKQFMQADVANPRYDGGVVTVEKYNELLNTENPLTPESAMDRDQLYSEIYHDCITGEKEREGQAYIRANANIICKERAKREARAKELNMYLGLTGEREPDTEYFSRSLDKPIQDTKALAKVLEYKKMICAIKETIERMVAEEDAGGLSRDEVITALYGIPSGGYMWQHWNNLLLQFAKKYDYDYHRDNPIAVSYLTENKAWIGPNGRTWEVDLFTETNSTSVSATDTFAIAQWALGVTREVGWSILTEEVVALGTGLGSSPHRFAALYYGLTEGTPYDVGGMKEGNSFGETDVSAEAYVTDMAHLKAMDILAMSYINNMPLNAVTGTLGQYAKNLFESLSGVATYAEGLTGINVDNINTPMHVMRDQLLRNMKSHGHIGATPVLATNMGSDATYLRDIPLPHAMAGSRAASVIGNASSIPTFRMPLGVTKRGQSSTSSGILWGGLFGQGVDNMITDSILPVGGAMLYPAGKDSERGKVEYFRNILAGIANDVRVDPRVLGVLGLEDYVLDEITASVKGSPAYPDLDLPDHPYYGDKLQVSPMFYMWDIYADAQVLNAEQRSYILEKVNKVVENSHASLKSFEIKKPKDKLEKQELVEVQEHLNMRVPKIILQPDGTDGVGGDPAMATAFSKEEEAQRATESLKQELGETQAKQLYSHMPPIGDNSFIPVRISNLEHLKKSGEVVGSYDYPALVSDETYKELKRLYEANSNSMFGSGLGFQKEPGKTKHTGTDLDKDPSYENKFTPEALKGIVRESSKDLFSRRKTMSRAFPTFKLYFIEEDEEESRYLSFDDFYSYNGVKDFTVVLDRNVAADNAVIRIQNISGTLDGTKRGAIVDADYYLRTAKNKLGKDTLEGDAERSEVTKDTNRDQPLNALILRPGLNIQLRAGYSNNPEMLEVLFSGRVVDVSWSQGGDLAEISVQSFGAELTQIVKGFYQEEPTYYTTHQVLGAMMLSPELKHFGRWEFNRILQVNESQDSRLDFTVYHKQGAYGVFRFLTSYYRFLRSGFGMFLLVAGSAALSFGGLGVAKLTGTTIRSLITATQVGTRSSIWGGIFKHAFLTGSGTHTAGTIARLGGEGGGLIRHVARGGGALSFGERKVVAIEISRAFNAISWPRKLRNKIMPSWMPDRLSLGRPTLKMAARERSFLEGAGTLDDIEDLVGAYNAERVAYQWLGSSLSNEGIYTFGSVSGGLVTGAVGTVFNVFSVAAGTSVNAMKIIGAGVLAAAALEVTKKTMDAIFVETWRDVKKFYTTMKASLFLSPQDDNLFPPHPSVYIRKKPGYIKAAVNTTMAIASNAITGSPDNFINFFDSDEMVNKKVYANNCAYTPKMARIWDVFLEMSYRHPGWVFGPRPYGTVFRYTMFFGLPSQRYWARPGSNMSVNRSNRLHDWLTSTASNAEKINMAYDIYGEKTIQSIINAERNRELYESVVNYVPSENGQDAFTNEYLVHDKNGNLVKERSASGATPYKDYGESYSISSAEAADVNGGSIMMSIESIVLREYLRSLELRFIPFRRYHVLTSETNIIANQIMGTSTPVANGLSLTYKTGLDFDSMRTDLFKSQMTISDSMLSTDSRSYEQCGSYSMARRYAVSILAENLRQAYRGELIVLGSPRIRPIDICIVSDSYNNMTGPIEVEQVVHNFSHETGFITEIKPSMVVHANEISGWPVLEAMKMAAVAIIDMETRPASGLREKLMKGVEPLGAVQVGALSTIFGHSPLTSEAYTRDFGERYAEVMTFVEKQNSLYGKEGAPTGDGLLDFNNVLKGGIVAAGVAGSIGLALLSKTRGGLILGAGISAGTILGAVAAEYYTRDMRPIPSLAWLLGAPVLFLSMLRDEAVIVTPLVKDGVPIAPTVDMSNPSTIYESAMGKLRNRVKDTFEGTADMIELYERYGQEIWEKIGDVSTMDVIRGDTSKLTDAYGKPMVIKE